MTMPRPTDSPPTQLTPLSLHDALPIWRRGLPAWPEYSASKFALAGFTEAFRAEMARFDIDVLLVIPGMTKTGLTGHMRSEEHTFELQSQFHLVCRLLV